MCFVLLDGHVLTLKILSMLCWGKGGRVETVVDGMDHPINGKRAMVDF